MTERENDSREGAIDALLVEPGQTPKVWKISPRTEVMRKIVGNSPRETWPFSEPIAVVYCDNAGTAQPPVNCLLKNGSGEPYEVIRGTFLVVGVADGTYISLTDAQIMWLLDVFRADIRSVVEGTKRTASGLKTGGGPSSNLAV